jgi:hypothetical protein
MYNGWGSIYWDSSVGDTAAWGLHLQSPPNVGVADQPLVDEFTTNYIVGGEALCLAPNFDNYTSEMGAISGITSPSNGSAEFNGTSDYIDVATIPLTDFTNHTMSAWFYTETTNQGTILGFGNSTTDTPISLIETRTNDVVRFSYRDDASTLVTKDTGTYTKGVWNYVTAVKEGNNFSIYLNGSLASTSSTTTGAITFDTFTIGVLKRTALANYFEDNLANVAIWNRALTSDEINSVMWKQYEEISTSERNGLQAWYSLDSVDSFDWYAYAQNQGAVIEGRTCVDNALNALAQL